MTFAKRLTVPFTTAADGSATVYSEVANGSVYSIRYKYTDADTGADFTITAEDTLQPIIVVTNAGTASIQWQPRLPVHDAAAAAITGGYAAPLIANERIKIVITGGGNVKSGTFEIVIA